MNKHDIERALNAPEGKDVAAYFNLVVVKFKEGKGIAVIQSCGGHDTMYEAMGCFDKNKKALAHTIDMAMKNMPVEEGRAIIAKSENKYEVLE